MVRYIYRFSLGLVFIVIIANAFPLWAAMETLKLRFEINLSGSDWQFTGAGEKETLPDIASEAFNKATWSSVSVPHNFQTRTEFDTLTKGWYRRRLTIDPSLAGKELYLLFEGAAAIAEVYVNGQHLGQHRGAYTRFVFDATNALHPGADNQLAILVDDSPTSTVDCLPSRSGLYKVWGGLYRKVWLIATAPVHIDPTDDAAPGVYLTPKDVSEQSAGLNVRVLLRNTSATEVRAETRVRVLDPAGIEVASLTAPATVVANSRASVELNATIDKPQLWEAKQGRLYRIETGVYINGQLVDGIMERTGFRWLKWDFHDGNVVLNGKRILLTGVNLHQEIESKGSAVADEDLIHNFDLMQDLGINFLRLCHYPHAQLEYDLCDERGILCWAENGNSNGSNRIPDIPGPTAVQITTEMVKQNYNHPSIVLWSVGNEASPGPADQCVPIVKALDLSRPVVVANMKQGLADTAASNSYPGWYGGSYAKWKPRGFISEIGAGGVVTTHCDYNQSTWKFNSYEPEEYQQLVAEDHFQKVFHDDNSKLGLFTWWCMRDLTDNKYKHPIGINSKGLVTYAGDKKDIYYLYRSFLRPNEPTIHITSQRYFIRRGAVDNGIKVYSNAKQLNLTLNGQMVSSLDNGAYIQSAGPYQQVGKKDPAEKDPDLEKIDNVFYWPVPLHVGKNVISVSDGAGHDDSAVIYFEGTNGLPESPTANLPLKDLTSSNAQNPAYYIDAPIHDQWPLYSDLDSTADNSWDGVPDEAKGATWLALCRVSKPKMATEVSFTLTRPMKLLIATDKNGGSDDTWSQAGFKEMGSGSFLWRNNELNLVPGKLLVHYGQSGETVRIPLGQQDAVVLLKAIQ